MHLASSLNTGDGRTLVSNESNSTVILYEEEEAPVTGARGKTMRQSSAGRAERPREEPKLTRPWPGPQPSDREETHFCQSSRLDCGFCHGCPGRSVSVGSETGTSTLRTSADFSGSSSGRQSEARLLSLLVGRSVLYSSCLPRAGLWQRSSAALTKGAALWGPHP